MTQITTLFWDNGGVILTNGWDRDSRRAAVEKFNLDWADFEDRHELMLDAFEKGTVSLDEYFQRTVFYRARLSQRRNLKSSCFDQSQPFPESLDFWQELGANTKRYHDGGAQQRIARNQRIPHSEFHLRDYFEAFFSSCYLGVRKPDVGHLQPGT